VIRGVLAPVFKDKVFNAVVALVPVLVVYEFLGVKNSPEVLFHDVAVLTLGSALTVLKDVNPAVAALIEPAPTRACIPRDRSFRRSH
jgi:hypothetical protein